MPKRLEVGYTYLDLCIDKYPKQSSHPHLLATQAAKISKSYVRSVIIELENTGSLTDPETTNLEKRCEKKRNNIIWTRCRRSFVGSPF
jgi:hypothetical protein